MALQEHAQIMRKPDSPMFNPLVEDREQVELWRAQFPVLRKKTYLNSGSYGALSVRVRDAVETYLDVRCDEGAAWDVWVDRLESVRTSIAQLLNATSDEIAITTSASAGINSLASAFDFSSSRNKVVISDFEFPTNAQIWHAQAGRGARIVRVAQSSDGRIPLEHFERQIDRETKLVAVTHVCYRNGAKLDIPGIARIAHDNGALLMVDGYQSIGSEKIDVAELDADFVVGGMLKYLLGTAGVGFLYVRDRLIESLTPTSTGWFAQENIAAMDIGGNHPSHTARRFESGTPPVPGLYASEAGLQTILEIGTQRIGDIVRALTGRCMALAESAGFKLATPSQESQRGPTVAIRTRDERAVVAELARNNIVTSCRDGNVRASFHYYNNDDDTDALIAGLQSIRHFLA